MINVGVVGATGYTGLELLRILNKHSEVSSILVSTSTSNKNETFQIIKLFNDEKRFSTTDFDSGKLKECDVVFFATPHGVAMRNVNSLINHDVKVIDLSADFRLKDSKEYSEWYSHTHTETDLLKEAVYGLPELYREEIKNSRIVAMPGCYPTAVILGFYPLLKANLINTGNLIADCKSGLSGAGKTPKATTMYSTASENFTAYGLTGHRHWPEIYQELDLIVSKANLQRKSTLNSTGLLFSPHLVPMIRGIEATLYCELNKVSFDTDVKQIFEKEYESEPFIEILQDGINPETSSVRGINTVKIAVNRPNHDTITQSNRVRIYVVEDNLVKGASGQAVQAMNIMFGIKETTGLELTSLIP